MTTLNYKVYGEGQPIIILHGLFGMLDNWRTIAKDLSEQYQVYLVDQRNHGKSPHSAEFNYPLLAEDIGHFVEQHKIKNPILIGHSMGGKTVMECLKNHPELIAKAIVVDIGPQKYKGGHESIFNAILNIDTTQATTRKEVQDELEKTISNTSVLLFLMKNLNRNPKGGYQWKANFQSLYDNYKHILSEIDIPLPISVPTLFIRGEESSYIQDEDIDKIHQNFLDVQVRTVNNAGHWVHAQNPTQLLEFIHAFID